jgi:transcriptional regulator with GAF, ATPase, and Fis domain
LKLPPLRDRKEDISTIAGWFARFYAKTVGLDEVVFSPAASERLSNYLWFGNLHELETVVARTLMLRRKSLIEAPELVFDFSSAGENIDLLNFEEFAPPEPKPKKEPRLVTAPAAVHNGLSAEPGSGNGHLKSADVNLVIHELGP